MLHCFARRLKEVREKDGEQGFTLIELLVVVIVIGILAAIAIPVFLNQRAQAQQAAAKSDLRNGAAAATACSAADNGSYETCTREVLDAAPFNWKHTAGVTDTTVVVNSATQWKATAKAADGTVFTFDTATGTVTP